VYIHTDTPVTCVDTPWMAAKEAGAQSLSSLGLAPQKGGVKCWHQMAPQHQPESTREWVQTTETALRESVVQSQHSFGLLQPGTVKDYLMSGPFPSLDTATSLESETV